MPATLQGVMSAVNWKLKGLLSPTERALHMIQAPEEAGWPSHGAASFQIACCNTAQYNLTGLPIEVLMNRQRTFCQFFLSRETKKLTAICTLT